MSEDVFRWVIAVGVLLACLASIWQAVILSAVYKAGKEAQKAGKEASNRLGPLLDRFETMLTSTNTFLTASSQVLEENRPRIADIATEATTIVKSTRLQVERINQLIDEASGRAKARLSQIDQAVDNTVVQVEQAGDAVKSAVLKPVKEVNGLVAGLKAALSTYAQGGNRSPENVTQDEEMFI